MRYAGEQPVAVRDPNQVALAPAVIIPIAAGLSALQKGYMLDKAVGVTGTSGGHGTLDDAINRGEPGLEREGAIRMNRGHQGQPTGGNGALVF